MNYISMFVFLKTDYFQLWLLNILFSYSFHYKFSLIPYSFHSFLFPLILSFILCYVNPSLLLNPSSLELIFFYFLPKYTLLLPTLLISRIRLTDTHTDISKIRPNFYPLSPPPSKLLTVSTSLSRP